MPLSVESTLCRNFPNLPRIGESEVAASMLIVEVARLLLRWIRARTTEDGGEECNIKFVYLVFGRTLQSSATGSASGSQHTLYAETIAINVRHPSQTMQLDGAVDESAVAGREAAAELERQMGGRVKWYDDALEEPIDDNNKESVAGVTECDAEMPAIHPASTTALDIGTQGPGGEIQAGGREGTQGRGGEIQMAGREGTQDEADGRSLAKLAQYVRLWADKHSDLIAELEEEKRRVDETGEAIKSAERTEAHTVSLADVAKLKKAELDVTRASAEVSRLEEANETHLAEADATIADVNSLGEAAAQAERDNDKAWLDIVAPLLQKAEAAHCQVEHRLNEDKERLEVARKALADARAHSQQLQQVQASEEGVTEAKEALAELRTKHAKVRVNAYICQGRINSTKCTFKRAQQKLMNAIAQRGSVDADVQAAAEVQLRNASASVLTTPVQLPAAVAAAPASSGKKSVVDDFEKRAAACIQKAAMEAQGVGGRRRLDAERSARLPSTTRPPQSSSGLPLSTSHPSTTRPPQSSSAPPPSTSRPPQSSSGPPPSASRPSASGIRPSASGIRPPASASRPPASASRPSASASRPPSSPVSEHNTPAADKQSGRKAGKVGSLEEKSKAFLDNLLADKGGDDGLQRYFKLCEAFGDTQPFAPGFPFRVDNTDVRLSVKKAEGTAGKRRDVMASTNYRLMARAHYDVLIPMMTRFTLLTEVQDKDLYATAQPKRVQQRKRGQGRTEPAKQQARYLRGDRIKIVQSVLRYYIANEETESPFFFPNKDLIAEYLRSNDSLEMRTAYPNMKWKLIKDALLKFDFIVLFETSMHTRMDPNRLEASCRSAPEQLYAAIPRENWRQLDSLSQRLLTSIMTKTAHNDPYQPRLTSLLNALARSPASSQLSMEISERLQEALQLHNDAATDGTGSGNNSDESDDDSAERSFYQPAIETEIEGVGDDGSALPQEPATGEGLSGGRSRSRSPARSRSRSPEARSSRSAAKPSGRARSPAGRRSRSPAGRRSRSPAGRRSRSPEAHSSHSAKPRGRSRSPARRSRSPKPKTQGRRTAQHDRSPQHTGRSRSPQQGSRSPKRKAIAKTADVALKTSAGGGKASGDALNIPREGWIVLSKGGTESVAGTLQRIQKNTPLCSIDTDSCKAPSANTHPRLGYSTIMGSGAAVRELTQRVMLRLQALLHRAVTVTPIVCRYVENNVGPCLKEWNEAKSRRVSALSNEHAAAVLILDRRGHGCHHRFVIVCIYARGVLTREQTTKQLDFFANVMLQGLRENPFRWMLTEAKDALCDCQGDADMGAFGRHKTFGCISVYKEGARTCLCGTEPDEKEPFEQGIEDASRQAVNDGINDIVAGMTGVLHNLAPAASKCQLVFSQASRQCRIGVDPERSPFSLLSVQMDASAHIHYNNQEMANGATVMSFVVDPSVITALQDNYRHQSDQVLVIPNLKFTLPGEQNTPSGLHLPIFDGAVFVCALSHLSHGITAPRTRIIGSPGTFVTSLMQGPCLVKGDHGRATERQKRSFEDALIAPDSKRKK